MKHPNIFAKKKSIRFSNAKKIKETIEKSVKNSSDILEEKLELEQEEVVEATNEPIASKTEQIDKPGHEEINSIMVDGFSGLLIGDDDSNLVGKYIRGIYTGGSNVIFLEWSLQGLNQMKLKFLNLKKDMIEYEEIKAGLIILIKHILEKSKVGIFIPEIYYSNEDFIRICLYALLKIHENEEKEISYLVENINFIINLTKVRLDIEKQKFENGTGGLMGNSEVEAVDFEIDFESDSEDDWLN